MVKCHCGWRGFFDRGDTDEDWMTHLFKMAILEDRASLRAGHPEEPCAEKGGCMDHDATDAFIEALYIQESGSD